MSRGHVRLRSARRRIHLGAVAFALIGCREYTCVDTSTCSWASDGGPSNSDAATTDTATTDPTTTNDEVSTETGSPGDTTEQPDPATSDLPPATTSSDVVGPGPDVTTSDANPTHITDTASGPASNVSPTSDEGSTTDAQSPSNATGSGPSAATSDAPSSDAPSSDAPSSDASTSADQSNETSSGPDTTASPTSSAASSDGATSTEPPAPMCTLPAISCDDNPDCETNLASTASCGTSCDNAVACSSSHGSPDCNAGACSIECSNGYLDCGGNNDGCETTLANLTTVDACGESCDEITACDALSGTACVNRGCRHDWPGWEIANSPVVDPTAPLPYSLTDNGDGTVSDDVSGLVWEQTHSAFTYTLTEADDYCSELDLGGHGDWRVPSYFELFSIVDFGRTFPALDVTRFPNTSNGSFWTMTPGSSQGSAWYINFIDGYTNYGSPQDGKFVRCVR